MQVFVLRTEMVVQYQHRLLLKELFSPRPTEASKQETKFGKQLKTKKQEI